MEIAASAAEQGAAVDLGLPGRDAETAAEIDKIFAEMVRH
jgi:hypothetical protein